MATWHKPNDRRQLTGRGWRRLRERIMARDKYLCVVCLAAGRIREATEVDHRVPIARGRSDDPANLQAICARCHRNKTITDNGGKPRVAVGADGWPLED